MKKALVILPYKDEDKQKLINSAAGKCEFLFLDKKANREKYLSALETANLIIGDVFSAAFLRFSASQLSLRE